MGLAEHKVHLVAYAWAMWRSHRYSYMLSELVSATARENIRRHATALAAHVWCSWWFAVLLLRKLATTASVVAGRASSHLNFLHMAHAWAWWCARVFMARLSAAVVLLGMA